MLKKKDYVIFEKNIQQKSKEYQTPCFEPHLTLRARILGEKEEVLTKTKQLASSIQPIKLKLVGLEQTDEFHRCIIERAELSNELKEARQKTEELFHSMENRPFLPHISVMYGELDLSSKKKIMNEIRSKLPSECLLDKLQLVVDTNQRSVWKTLALFQLKQKLMVY